MDEALDRHFDSLIEAIVSHIERHRRQLKEMLAEAVSRRADVLSVLSQRCDFAALRHLLERSDFPAFSAALDSAFKTTGVRLIAQNTEAFQTLTQRLKASLSESRAKDVSTLA
eukprot:TRINITY_DN2409_c0_g1_i6.p2 TRINITY_DN2409_c0_g1~~TRINITY_DN2409_c0_g1_i6.p2  ORF type:complete len:113 (-),score=32.84 TRINITY_DN2409_c0_g1_i6:630-968(-)